MKFRVFVVRQALLILLSTLTLAMTGCSIFSTTQRAADPMQRPVVKTNSDTVARLHVGDTITITLKGPPPPNDIAPVEKPIKDDGTITLDYIGSVKAAGKTPGQLEDLIHNLYVPKYYTHLNVTVQTSNDRVYFVRGEVKNPGRMVYTGDITVSQAITSAGDFTDFADRSDVYLTRANGQRFKLNMNRILAGKDPDPPVYPGDQIQVTRRIF